MSNTTSPAPKSEAPTTRTLTRHELEVQEAEYERSLDRQPFDYVGPTWDGEPDERSVPDERR